MEDIQLLESIFTLSRLMKGHMSYDSRFRHLSMLQLQALLYINTHTDCQMSEIANYFNIELPSATSLINTLQKAKLIQRNADEKDRRLVRISLTPAGKTLLGNALEERQKKVGALLKHLSLEDKKSLQLIVQKLILIMEDIDEK